MNPLDDLCRTRTNRDRAGTIPDQITHSLLLRDLERLISQGLVERVTDIREISVDSREKIWYQEVATGDLYVYVSPWERGAAEFRRFCELSPSANPQLIQ
jgi:hypothetical protein